VRNALIRHSRLFNQAIVENQEEDEITSLNSSLLAFGKK
jgi:hypothetical protein